MSIFLLRYQLCSHLPSMHFCHTHVDYVQVFQLFKHQLHASKHFDIYAIDILIYSPFHFKLFFFLETESLNVVLAGLELAMLTLNSQRSTYPCLCRAEMKVASFNSCFILASWLDWFCILGKNNEFLGSPAVHAYSPCSIRDWGRIP